MISRLVTAVTIGTFSSNLIGRTVDLTCDRTFKLLSYWGTRQIHSFPELHDLIISLDIRTKIGRISQTMAELSTNLPDSIVKSIGDVIDAVNQINTLLDDIQRAENYQRSLYFSGWRRFDCQRFISELCLLNNLLDNRLKLLNTLLKISSSSQSLILGPKAN